MSPAPNTDTKFCRDSDLHSEEWQPPSDTSATGTPPPDNARPGDGSTLSVDAFCRARRPRESMPLAGPTRILLPGLNVITPAGVDWVLVSCLRRRIRDVAELPTGTLIRIPEIAKVLVDDPDALAVRNNFIDGARRKYYRKCMGAAKARRAKAEKNRADTRSDERSILGSGPDQTPRHTLRAKRSLRKPPSGHGDQPLSSQSAIEKPPPTPAHALLPVPPEAPPLQPSQPSEQAAVPNLVPRPQVQTHVHQTQHLDQQPLYSRRPFNPDRLDQQPTFHHPHPSVPPAPPGVPHYYNQTFSQAQIARSSFLQDGRVYVDSQYLRAPLQHSLSGNNNSVFNVNSTPWQYPEPQPAQRFEKTPHYDVQGPNYVVQNPNPVFAVRNGQPLPLDHHQHNHHAALSNTLQPLSHQPAIPGPTAIGPRAEDHLNYPYHFQASSGTYYGPAAPARSVQGHLIAQAQLGYPPTPHRHPPGR